MEIKCTCGNRSTIRECKKFEILNLRVECWKCGNIISRISPKILEEKKNDTN